MDKRELQSAVVRPLRPLERLLEETWEKRSMPANSRVLSVEAGASALFLFAAVPLAVSALAAQHLRVDLAALLVVLYAVFSRSFRLPIGAGSFMPSYLVLVPMLVLLPPGTVPLVAGLGASVGTLVQWAFGRLRVEKLLTALADCWYAIGPALVFTLAGQRAGQIAGPMILIAAFGAGCLIDLTASTLREWLTETVAPTLQLRVVLVVWAIDACIAPLGLLVAVAAHRDTLELLLLLPLAAVLMVADHDRRLRIAEARERFMLAIQRERVQQAAQRVSDALAARLDLGALGNVLLEAALHVVAADSGYLVLGGDLQPIVRHGPKAAELRAQLDAASGAAWANAQPCHLESEDRFALAMPLSALGRSDGVVALARSGRGFAEPERTALQALVDRVARESAAVPTYQELRVTAFTDPLTGIGNRRKLTADMRARLSTSSQEHPLALALFDLDGFKGYNDLFGQPAGDAMLTKLASRLAMAVSADGAAYRLGGDEFCILIVARSPAQLAAASEALSDDSTEYPITASFGSVLLPREARRLDEALSLADKRMYQHKHERAKSAASLRNLFRIA
jgi:diguanylate cyclase (GGDEF)-like protein